ncbi:MAG: 16S rRNA (guanine(527)-N(7))-methyltransferase RsmG [Geminicoccaceae bacterium]
MRFAMQAVELARKMVGEKLGVSRETLSRLDIHVANLTKWQRRINLIGMATDAEIWERHILDSGQLAAHLPQGSYHILDLGSGAGFPGLVLATLQERSLTLIESDRRKAAFLRETARLLGCAGVDVVVGRIETQNLTGKVITARALAPLDRLISYAEPLLEPGGCCFFLKGREYEREIEEARRRWKMRIELLPSITSEFSRILKIDEVSRVQ